MTLRTENLAALPKTVAAAQSLLSLGGIDFRLSKAARERVEGQLIQQAIANSMPAWRRQRRHSVRHRGACASKR